MEGGLHLSSSIWCSLIVLHLCHEQFLKPTSCFFMGWEIHKERFCVTLFPVILSHKENPYLFFIPVLRSLQALSFCVALSIFSCVHSFLLFVKCYLMCLPILPSLQLKWMQGIPKCSFLGALTPGMLSPIWNRDSEEFCLGKTGWGRWHRSQHFAAQRSEASWETRVGKMVCTQFDPLLNTFYQ